MKKIIILVVLMALVFIRSVSGCSIDLNPAELSEAKVGQQVLLTVTIDRPHRSCSLPVEQTSFEAGNLIILEKGAWLKTSESSGQCSLKVKITDRHAELKVIRNCPKKGQTVEVFQLL
jgi:hypothetical protein